MIIRDQNGKLKIVKKDRNSPCFMCGAWGAEEHHCMNKRSLRDKADKLGLTVMLCSTCHYLLHNGHSPYMDSKTYLKKLAEEAYINDGHTSKQWYDLFYENNI